MDKSGIYVIKNLVNGKIYIGSSVTIQRRWYSHKSRLRRNVHKNLHLQNAWNLYGEENFEFEIIALHSDRKGSLLKLEQWYLDNWSPDYNICVEAEAGRRGIPLRQETIDKIKETKRKTKHLYSGENNHFYGRKHSNETKNKLSKIASERILSKAHRDAISMAQIGEKSHYAKLTWEKVREIRRLYEQENWTENMLIEKFQMSQSAINKIVRYKTWRE